MNRIHVQALRIVAVLLFALAVNTTPESVLAQDAKPAAAAAAKKPAKPRGRLPAYYGEVVDAAQREKIYAIQQSYAERIAALQAQLKDLNEKMDAEVKAVLTPEQQKKLDELSAAAKARRQARTGAAAAAKAGEASAATPAAKATAAPAKKTGS